MSNDKSTWEIALDDSVSQPAQSAGDALARLRDRVIQARRAVVSTGEAMQRLRSRGIAALKTAAARAGGALRAAGQDLRAFADRARDMPGPLGSIAGRLQGLRPLLAGGPLLIFAAGILAIGAASAALLVAVGAATVALLRYGIAQAEARRSEALRFETLVRLRSMYGLAAGSASELQAAIDRVSDSTASGRGEIGQYAEQLYRMGLRGAALEEALEGMAIAGSAGGERLARRFAGLAVGAARMGRSVRAVADDFRARFGPIAAAQALSVDRQMLRLRQNVARIFDGLKLEPLLRGLRSVTSLFSQSTSSGRALRRLVERLLSPIIDQAPAAGIVMRRFIQGMILGTQRLTLQYLRLRNQIRAAFGSASIGGIDAQTLALNAGTLVVLGFAAAVVTAGIVLGALAAALGVVAVGALVFATPFLLAARGVVAAVDAIRNMISAGRELIAWWGTVDWTSLGTSLVNGIVRGLTRGREIVVSSVARLAREATRALTDALQIRSPSRVFAELGLQIPRGLAAGVDRGAGDAERAVDTMMDVPSSAPSGAHRGAAGARSARVAVSIGDVHVHAGQTADPRELARAFRDELVRELEGVGIELGAT